MKRICWYRIAAFLMALGLVLVAVSGFVVLVSAEEEPELVEYVFGSDDVPLVASGADFQSFTFSDGHCYQYGPYGWPYFNNTEHDKLHFSFDVTKGYTVWLKWINGKTYANGLTPYEVWNVSSLVNAGYTNMSLTYSPTVYSQCVVKPDSQLTIRCFDSNFETIGFLYSDNFHLLLNGSPQSMGHFDIPVGTVYLEFYLALTFEPADIEDYGNNIEGTIDCSSDKSLRFIFSKDTYVPPEETEPTEPTSPSTPGGSGGDSGSGSGGSSGGGSFDDTGIINSVTSSADRIISEVGKDIENQTGIITDSIADQTGLLTQSFSETKQVLKDGFGDLNDNFDKTNEKLDSTNQNLETMIGDGSEGDELQSGSDSITSDTDSVSDFEKEQQSVLDDNFESIQNEINFSSYINALVFVQQILNLAFLNMGDVRIIYSFPLFLGMFFFLCSRAPGAVRPTKVYHKDRAVPR